MKTSETASETTVAASAADRDSLTASLHIKPFIALALAVLLPTLGRNPRSGSRPDTIKHATTQAVIEEGNATGVGDDWTYTATTNLPAGQAVRIEVTAKDGTEHVGQDTKNYP